MNERQKIKLPEKKVSLSVIIFHWVVKISTKKNPKILLSRILSSFNIFKYRSTIQRTFLKGIQYH